MITLHTFGPGAGLPDFSPFVVKAMMLLKLAGLPYTEQPADVRKSPKHKLPVIVDDGQTVADSTFIRFHIEKKYGFDFNAGLTHEQKAVAWAAEKMLENHTYWVALHERWSLDGNFDLGPARLFETIPALIRPFIKPMVRKSIAKDIHAAGMGRHSYDEMIVLAQRDIDAIATLLGDKPFFMGETPCAADATVFAFLQGALCDVFSSRIGERAREHGNLVAYVRRLQAAYFPVSGATAP